MLNSSIRKSTGLITSEDWNALIASTPFLQKVPERKGINPFTQQPVVFSGEGKAHVLINGKLVGNISLENGQLLTTGVPRRICAEIALKLGAQVYEADLS